MLGSIVMITTALAAASTVMAQSSTFGQSTGNITINPLPKFETCKPVNISWSGGNVPGEYVLYFFPDGSAGDEILLFVNNIKDQFYVWPVFLEAGTKFLVNVFDQDKDQFAGPFTIEDSGDTSCVVPIAEYRSSLSAVAGTEPTMSGAGSPGISSVGSVGSLTSSDSKSATPASMTAPPQSSSASPSASGSTQPNNATKGIMSGMSWGIVIGMAGMGWVARIVL